MALCHAQPLITPIITPRFIVIINMQWKVCSLWPWIFQVLSNIHKFSKNGPTKICLHYSVNQWHTIWQTPISPKNKWWLANIVIGNKFNETTQNRNEVFIQHNHSYNFPYYDMNSKSFALSYGTTFHHL